MLVKIISFAIVSGIVVVYLKSVNSELTFLALIGAGIVILSFSMEYLYENLSFLSRLVDLTGIDPSFYKIIYKITAIGYLVEFGAGTVEDFGLKSLADKLVFVGKMMIISISLPILQAVINLIIGLVEK